MNFPYFNDHPEANNVRELVSMAYTKYNGRTAFSYRKSPSDQKATEVSFQKVAYDVKCFGTEAIARNMHKAHCALIGKLSYNWIISYLSLLSVGAAVVPLDGEWSEESLAETVKDSDCTFLICDYEILKKVDAIRSHANISYTLYMNDDDSFETFIESGRSRVINGDNSFSKLPIDPTKMSLIVYTSGTTGKGKGVMLSQKAILSNIAGAFQLLRVGKKTIAVLPPHHTYGSTIGILAPLCGGTNVYISNGLRYLLHEFKTEKPDFMILVPLFLETFSRKIMSTIKEKKKEKLFKAMMWVNNGMRRIGIDVSEKLFSSVLSVFGGNLDMIVCGGAPLSPETIDFFSSLGITVLNGYGITECSPLISVNRREDIVEGSVGVPIPCDRIKIDAAGETGEGEICVSGPNVMLGYYKNTEATEECIDGDGYFHTGDIGRIDEEGHLYITGRIKNLIILSNGKNVYPEEIETELSAIPGVQDIVVYEGISIRGIQHNAIVAEFYMDSDYIAKNDIVNIEEYLKPYIDKYNKTAIQYKKINIVRVRDTEFPKNTLRKIMRFKIDRTID